MSLDRLKKALNEGQGDFGGGNRYEHEFSSMLDSLGISGAWKRKYMEEYIKSPGHPLINIIGRLWGKLKGENSSNNNEPHYNYKDSEELSTIVKELEDAEDHLYYLMNDSTDSEETRNALKPIIDKLKAFIDARE